MAGAGAAAVSTFATRSGLAASSQASAPVATTTAGKVRGSVDRGVHVFRGVRYGGDTAACRFMAPVPPEPWAGVT